MRSWLTQEVVDGATVKALNVIIPTRGCSWRRCTMCSYSLEAEEREFIPEFRKLMEAPVEKVKIFTSGSFLDKKELPLPARNEILDIVKEKGVRELTVETRPEYAEEALSVQSYLEGVRLEVAIGLESADERVLKYCINKGFTYADFENAIHILEGIKIKAYLLIKPPFLTEYEAVEDAVHAAERIEDVVDVISFNPVVIHKKTLLEYVWRTGGYHPPWVWSVVEVLNRTRHLRPHIICHPVALGKRRGIRNCGKCDFDIAEKIREYSLRNEEIVHECECKERWEKEMERI